MDALYASRSFLSSTEADVRHEYEEPSYDVQSGPWMQVSIHDRVGVIQIIVFVVLHAL